MNWYQLIEGKLRRNLLFVHVKVRIRGVGREPAKLWKPGHGDWNASNRQPSSKTAAKPKSMRIETLRFGSKESSVILMRALARKSRCTRADQRIFSGQLATRLQLYLQLALQEATVSFKTFIFNTTTTTPRACISASRLRLALLPISVSYSNVSASSLNSVERRRQDCTQVKILCIH